MNFMLNQSLQIQSLNKELDKKELEISQLREKVNEFDNYAGYVSQMQTKLSFMEDQLTKSTDKRPLSHRKL